MNAVEIEEAVSAMVEAPFEAGEFPYAFLAAFGNKDTTIKRLRTGNTNKSDLPGGLLQRNNIHLAVCNSDEVGDTLRALVASPATTTQKAKYALATDGQTIEAENLVEGETLACGFADLANHFGFFLPLAGITTVKEIRENAFDIKATGRLNKLYIELLKENPDWDTSARRADLNHFFAEDTNIFGAAALFTARVEQMSASDSSNTHEVLSEIFRAMKTKPAERTPAMAPSPAPKGRPSQGEGVFNTLPLGGSDAPAAGEGIRPTTSIRPWANVFPYVNGGLFSGSTDVPRFSKLARSYLIHIGHLDWQQINPDIFGSMIQAVADDEERGALGMHYTSVPNILKVLNPLFLDDLREKLAEAGDNKRKLLNLRNRLAKIRIFDPACGSGNFLVIAYKEMRKIEAEINRRRGEEHFRSEIPLTNFRGIELRNFSAEIARLALIIAEYQCDVLYRGQQIAVDEFLPLEADNWITCGNALRLDWLKICPPTGTGVKVRGDDLFETPLDQAENDFENEGGETYICGNPPYVGDKKQSKNQKLDVKHIFSEVTTSWKSLDYVCGFFYRAHEYLLRENGVCAFVATNSIVQGQHVPRFWSLVIAKVDICFAVRSFKWANLATNKAGVTCVVVAICRNEQQKTRFIYDGEAVRQVTNISPYLTAGTSIIVSPTNKSISGLPKMTLGNVPKDDGGLLMTCTEREELKITATQRKQWTKLAIGSTEFIQGKSRYCLWIEDQHLEDATRNETITDRIEHVRCFREKSVDPGMAKMAKKPHQFREMNIPKYSAVLVPRVSSENREFLPTGLFNSQATITDRNYAIYDGPLWCPSLIASRLHWVWIATVCVRMRTDFSYSNTLGWNTFPVPPLSDQNKADLTRCAEDILLAREAHFPATIADLYDPDAMPADLRAAHDRNDETLERIYIGRRFKNDTERLEKLFEMYTAMTAGEAESQQGKAKKGTKQ